eukprot:5635683-Pyramimonas_sp.AAC.1
MLDEHGEVTEADGSTVSTITANPQCEETLVFIKETAGVEPIAGQPASSSAGAPAPNDARTCIAPQDAKGM